MRARLESLDVRYVGHGRRLTPRALPSPTILPLTCPRPASPGPVGAGGRGFCLTPRKPAASSKFPHHRLATQHRPEHASDAQVSVDIRPEQPFARWTHLDLGELSLAGVVQAWSEPCRKAEDSVVGECHCKATRDATVARALRARLDGPCPPTAFPCPGDLRKNLRVRSGPISHGNLSISPAGHRRGLRLV